MARRTPSRAAPSKGRDTKARSRKAAPAPEASGIEVVEEEKGMGIGDGMTLATTLMLLAACLLTDYLLGAHYGAGLFFK